MEEELVGRAAERIESRREFEIVEEVGKLTSEREGRC